MKFHSGLVLPAVITHSPLLHQPLRKRVQVQLKLSSSDLDLSLTGLNHSSEGMQKCSGQCCELMH